jgi:hypothetical protein
MAASQAVAVAYSGCEMRIVDGCNIKGSYRWQQTTIATDTVEISDADELYAKLPLGAVSLEGELTRSGRLAVRTTVSGQMKLGEVDTTNVPREGACAAATHVVSALSVGTFKLLSGGAIKASGGASVAGIGKTGGSTARDESVVREAGDPAKCAESTEEKPNAACSSPVQVFLLPIERPPTAEETKAREEESHAQATGGVRFSFAAPDTENTWLLKAQDGTKLCTLPCQRWVAPDNGYYLEMQAAQVTDIVRIDVDQRWQYTGGQSVDARVDPRRGSVLGSLAAMGVSVIPTVLGMYLLIDNPRNCYYGYNGVSGAPLPEDGSCPSKLPTATAPLVSDQARIDPAVEWGLLGGGAAALAASIVWLVWSHGWRLDEQLAEPPRTGMTPWFHLSASGVAAAF